MDTENNQIITPSGHCMKKMNSTQLIKWLQDWKDGTVGKSPGCSSRGCRVNSQHPRHYSLLSLSSSSRGSDALVSPLQVPGLHIVHRHACTQNKWNFLVKNLSALGRQAGRPLWSSRLAHCTQWFPGQSRPQRETLSQKNGGGGCWGQVFGFFWKVFDNFLCLR